MKLSKDISCQSCQNSICFIKACLPKWILLISEAKTVISYKKDEHIFTTGDSIAGIFFIKNGKVKVTTNGWHGKEQIVRLAANGHILGHRGYGSETYPISALALDESRICLVDNNTLNEAFMNNPRFTYRLMMFYSQELRGIEARIKTIAQMTVAEKVISALLYLKQVFGYDETGENVLNIAFSRADMAALAGISKEQVVRCLSDFEKEKWIAKKKIKIRIMEEEKLMKMVEAYK
ncbi:MAG: Crp/Fnr family transcriptional regulator [Bacteroidia bacterium]